MAINDDLLRVVQEASAREEAVRPAFFKIAEMSGVSQEQLGLSSRRRDIPDSFQQAKYRTPGSP